MQTYYLFVLICTLLVFVNVGVVHVFAESDVPCEQKVYWEWDNEKTDDIDVESLPVVIDKYHSDVNKIHTNAFFGNFEKTYITDLTAIEGDIETLKYLICGMFCL